MPAPDTLERFIAMVESNAHAEACEQFYTEHSTMQENQGEPRVGRGAARRQRTPGDGARRVGHVRRACGRCWSTATTW